MLMQATGFATALTGHPLYLRLTRPDTRADDSGNFVGTITRLGNLVDDSQYDEE